MRTITGAVCAVMCLLLGGHAYMPLADLPGRSRCVACPAILAPAGSRRRARPAGRGVRAVSALARLLIAAGLAERT